MADRYWVGGTGTWNTTSTTNWSATPSGASGASVPTVADSVFFDQAGTYTVTCTGLINCLDITVSAGTVTFAQGTSPFLSIRGSMFLVAGTVWSVGSGLNFTSTTPGRTVTTNGTTLSASTVQFNGVGGGWTLGSALTTSNSQGVTITAGSFDTGNYNVTCGPFRMDGTSTRSVKLGSSTISFGNGNTGTVWNAGTVTNLSFDAGTSNLTSPTSILTFAGGGLIYNNLSLTNTGAGLTKNIQGKNTFNNLAVTGPASAGVVTVTFDAQQTINGTLSTTGTAGNRRVFFASATYGISQDLVVNSAPILTDCDFRGLYVRGTAAPISGTRIGNRGECRGITFSTPKTIYWNLSGGGNWTDTAWALSNGGAVSTDNFPLPQDTATVTNTGLITSGSITLNINDISIGNFDMSGRTNAMTLNVFVPATVYGNWTNGSGVTFSTANAITFSGGTTQTITSAGRTFSFPITIDTYGGTVQLADPLNIGSNTLTVTNGTFNTAGQLVTCGPFSSSNINVRTINLSSSTVNCSSANLSTSTNLTFNAGTSQVNVGGTFQVFGITWNNVTISGGGGSSVTFSTNSTFNNLSFSPPVSPGIFAVIIGGNITVNSVLTCAGASPIRRVFLQSDTLSTPRTLTVNGMIAQDCDFRDITLAGAAAGTSHTRAGDCNGNTGITFPAPKTVYWSNLGGNANWSSPCWASSSGGTLNVNSFPLAQDTAVFDNAGAAGTVTIDSGWNVGTLDMSARTAAITVQRTNNTTNIYGDLKNGTGVTWTGSVGAFAFSKIGTQTITSNGTPFAGGSFLMFRPGSYVQLADAFTFNGYISYGSGTFDAVTYNVTVLGVDGTTTPLALKLKLGTGTWTLTGTDNIFFIQGAATIEGSATIVLSNNTTAARGFGTTAFGGYIEKLIIGGTSSTSTTSISGAYTFGEIASTKTVAHTIAFGTASVTFGKWSVTGTPGNVVTITGTTTTNMIAGSAVTGVDYLAMGSWGISVASPGEFYAGANSTGTAAAPVFRTAAPAPRTLYWVGGTGSWSDTTKWSLASGGTGGEAIPTSLDAVIFNPASNATAYTVTLAGVSQARCANFTMAGPASGNVTLAGNVNMVFHGNVNFAATGVTRTFTSPIILSGNSTSTFTSNGITFASGLDINGVGATWVLGSPFTTANGATSCNLILGTLDTSVNNHSMSFSGFLTSFGTGIRSLKLNGSTCTFGTNVSGGQTVYNAINLAIIPGSYTIQIAANGTNWGTSNGVVNFNNVSFTSQNADFFNINGTNTFNTLSFASHLSGIRFITFNANQTIGTLTISAAGNATIRTCLRSDVIGTPRTLTCSATNVVADIDFRDITIAGAVAPISGTRLGDCKGNSGITFPAPKTVYSTISGGSWGAAIATWSLTPGGVSNLEAFPLAQDTAVFGATNPTAGNSVTINDDYNIGTIDMSARTSNTMTLATGSTTPTIYGNWINGTGTTLAGSGDITFAGRGFQTITSAGKTFTQTFTFNNPGGSVNLQDAFIGFGSGQFSILAGTFNANSYSVTLPFSQVSSSGSQIRTVNFSSGTWTLGQGGNAYSASGTNFTALGTATLNFTSTSPKNFGGGGFNYSGITINQGGSGSLTISGNNTLKTITNSFSATGATTINLNNNTQTLIESWAAGGQDGRVLTITGLSSAAPASLIFSGVGTASNISHVNISHVRAYPINNTWNTVINSTNSGILGWVFTDINAVIGRSGFFTFF
jgi:hypothetical protein